MARTVSIGKQDYKIIRENNYFYVDKTNFIKEWWESGDDVTLITRPRRFGKTLTMSMVENFFSIENAGREDLFAGLSIWKDEKYRKLQGTYPVIFLSFAKAKGNCFELLYGFICDILYNAYRRYTNILHNSVFSKDETEEFEDRKNFLRKHAVSSKISDALNFLCDLLYKYYKKKVIILLDEYDTPMQEAYTKGCWDEMADFVKELFDATFKTNPNLERAIMTGITRVSKESVFSGLNNLKVATVISNKYQTSFGFTETEVFDSLDEFGLSSERQKVKEWYDGFCFGDCKNIYNPWSIINFLDERKYGNYWANTSSNALVSKLIQEGSPAVKTAMEDLLQGKSISAEITEDITFKQLDYDEYAIWSLLLASGYLKIEDSSYNEFGYYECLLSLTNKEMEFTFRSMFRDWFASVRTNYNGFIKALLSDNVKQMNDCINTITKNVISYLDAGKRPSAQSEPERFYHGLVLGLIAELQGEYRIESNRESGFGRYDVIMESKDNRHDSMIMEFKVIDPERERDLQSATGNALKQIIEREYAASLEASGVSHNRIRIYGFAFEGKEVLIEGGYLSAFEGKDSHCLH